MDEGTYYFLSRPRRFGKSLFVDPLKELFEGNEPLWRRSQPPRPAHPPAGPRKRASSVARMSPAPTASMVKRTGMLAARSAPAGASRRTGTEAM